MPFHPDIVELSRIERTGDIIRYHRGFIYDQIDTTGLQSHQFLANVFSLPGFPGMNSYLPDVTPSLQLVSVIIEGLLPNAVRGTITYTNEAGGVPTVYYINRSSRRYMLETNVHPITRKPIRIADSVLEGMGQNGVYPTIPGDYAKMRFPVSAKVIRVTGVRYGAPSSTSSGGTFALNWTPISTNGGSSSQGGADGSDSVGYTNDAPWQGRQKGHWLIDEYETSHNVYGGYSTLSVSTSTKGPDPMDWSEVAFLFNRQSQRFFRSTTTDTDVAAAMALPYECSEDIGGFGANGKGFVRAGGPPLVNFPNVIGF